MTTSTSDNVCMIHKHTYTHARTHTRTSARMHCNIYCCARTPMLTHVHTNTHIHTRTDAHHTDTRTHERTHAHTQNCPVQEPKSSTHGGQKAFQIAPKSSLKTTWELQNKRRLPETKKNRISASGYIQEYTKRAPNLVSGRLRDSSK